MKQDESRPSLIQHEVRPEVKKWIETEARKQERSQRWFMSRIVEDAFKRAQGATA